MLGRLLEGGHSVVAGRLAGAFRRVGRAEIADEIMKTMKGAGYECGKKIRSSREQTFGVIQPGTAADRRANARPVGVDARGGR